MPQIRSCGELSQTLSSPVPVKRQLSGAVAVDLIFSSSEEQDSTCSKHPNSYHRTPNVCIRVTARRPGTTAMGAMASPSHGAE